MPRVKIVFGYCEALHGQRNPEPEELPESAFSEPLLTTSSKGRLVLPHVMNAIKSFFKFLYFNYKRFWIERKIYALKQSNKKFERHIDIWNNKIGSMPYMVTCLQKRPLWIRLEDKTIRNWNEAINNNETQIAILREQIREARK